MGKSNQKYIQIGLGWVYKILPGATFILFNKWWWGDNLWL